MQEKMIKDISNQLAGEMLGRGAKTMSEMLLVSYKSLSD
jgi:hypothetical protein